MCDVSSPRRARGCGSNYASCTPPDCSFTHCWPSPPHRTPRSVRLEVEWHLRHPLSPPAKSLCPSSSLHSTSRTAGSAYPPGCRRVQSSSQSNWTSLTWMTSSAVRAQRSTTPSTRFEGWVRFSTSVQPGARDSNESLAVKSDETVASRESDDRHPRTRHPRRLITLPVASMHSTSSSSLNAHACARAAVHGHG